MLETLVMLMASHVRNAQEIVTKTPIVQGVSVVFKDQERTEKKEFQDANGVEDPNQLGGVVMTFVSVLLVFSPF